MANYYATARTSYAKMKDDDKFKEWAATIEDSTVISQESAEHGTLYGLMFDGGDETGIPSYRYNEETDENEDFDIYGDIQGLLADGWSMLFVEGGAEKYRYVCCFGAVVTKEEVKTTTISEWFSNTLTELGDPNSTYPEY